MPIKKNIIITSLLCTLLTKAASNTFPQSLTTHHSVPVAVGAAVGYIIGNQLDHNPFGPVSLTCAAMGTFAGTKLDTFLSKNKIAPLVAINNKLMHEATTNQKQHEIIHMNPRLSEFEILKAALYKAKGDQFKYWFESRYKNRHPTKEAAWALYWQINDKVTCITDCDGMLQANVTIKKQNIMLTDTIWQEMLSIKNRILKHEAESRSLQR